MTTEKFKKLHEKEGLVQCNTKIKGLFRSLLLHVILEPSVFQVFPATAVRQRQRTESLLGKKNPQHRVTASHTMQTY